MGSPQEIVQIVLAVEEKRWIPDELRDWTFFSKYDVWSYESENTENRCENCDQFVGMTFFGDELRTIFPDLLIVDSMTIYPRVHLTLWGKDTCRCKLHRTAQPKAARVFDIRD